VSTPPSREEHEALRARVEGIAGRVHDLANHVARNDVSLIDAKDTIERLERALRPTDDAAKPVTRADVRLLVMIILAVAAAAFAFGVWLNAHGGRP